MWIFLCGGYRTGSALYYNLVGDVIQKTNTGIKLGFKQPKRFDEIFERYDSRRKYVIFRSHRISSKMREAFKNGNAVGFRTIRDFRDVVVSYAHKMDVSYDESIEQLHTHLKIFRSWSLYSPIHVRKYEEFAFNIEDEIIRIANILNVHIKYDQVTEIAKARNITATKKYISEVDYTNNKFDTATSFHQNHINSGKINQWKEKLSDKQIARIEEITHTWMRRQGYQLSSELVNQELVEK